ncbi:MAG: methyltransferase domain-containing protein [Mycobacteriaceae bacterium]
MQAVNTRWQRTAAARGADYDARWSALAAGGQNIHGEADLVEALLSDSGARSVLDAGCGTGRVAIELARRGFAVAGVDADTDMLAAARAKAPALTWLHGDLADPDTVAQAPPADLVLLAGNVMIFVEPGTEECVVVNLAGRLNTGGLLVAGFRLQPEGLTLARYDEITGAAGLWPVARWATWDRQPFDGGDYAVSVHGTR